MFLILALFVILFTPQGYSLSYNGTDDSVYMMVLNIGKADCIILSYLDKHFMVDTGYERTSSVMLTALNQMGIDHLDGVFITHCDKDHVGGLNRLLASPIQVDTVYYPAFSLYKMDENHPVIKATTEHNVPALVLNAKETLSFGDINFQVLGPLYMDTENENNNSLVMTMGTKHGSILLTGDMKFEEEFTLLKEKLFTKCDVLKVAFHGDNSSTSAAFLNATRPRMSVITTSTKEEADTPSPDTLRALKGIGCETYVTQDTQDAYLIVLNNNTPKIKEVSYVLPPKNASIMLTLKTSKDLLYLDNMSKEDISLKGMSIFSTRGEEYFVIQEDIILPKHGSIKLTGSASNTQADIVFPHNKRIFHKSKYDQVLLFDAYGRNIASTNNGLPE